MTMTGQGLAFLPFTQKLTLVIVTVDSDLAGLIETSMDRYGEASAALERYWG
jgi:hypothetical protein